jgi:hypothetical protein
VGNLEVKKPLERPRRRWEDCRIMDLDEIGWNGVDWSHLGGPVEGSCEHGNEPSDSIKC